MRLERFLVAILLLAGPSAQAQRVAVIVPTAGRVTPAAPLPQLPALTTLPAPAFSPLASAPSLLVAAPAAAPTLKLSVVSAAVQEFSKIDASAAPAAEARGAADDLMARALGGEVARNPATTEETLSVAVALAPSRPTPAPARVSRVYLLSKPLHETVELGPVARSLHYVLEVAFHCVTSALAWHATGMLGPSLTLLAFNLAKSPPTITAQSLADLGLRYWWRKLSTLRRLADTPGVTRIRVLTTGETEFSGILARRQANTGLVFLDAREDIARSVPGFGSALPVAEQDARRMRLVLEYGGVAHPAAWTPTLDELLSGAPMPEDIAAAWRALLDEHMRGKTPFQRLFDFSHEKALRVQAHLSGGADGERPLGTVAFGHSVKRLVGLSRPDRLKALFGAVPAPRAIHISDTTVERDGERLVEGSLRRAWRRLTGGLIVRRSP